MRKILLALTIMALPVAGLQAFSQREEDRWFWDKGSKSVGVLDPHNQDDVRFCRAYADRIAHSKGADFVEAYDPATENSCIAAGLYEEGKQQ